MFGMSLTLYVLFQIIEAAFSRVYEIQTSAGRSDLSWEIPNGSVLYNRRAGPMD